MKTNKVMEKSFVITCVVVNDSKKTLRLNEEKMNLYYGARNGAYPWEIIYDDISFSDKGAYDMHQLYKEEGVLEILESELPEKEADHLLNRYGLEHLNLKGLLEKMPQYAAAYVDLEEITNGRAYKESFLFIKEADKPILSFRVLPREANYAQGLKSMLIERARERRR